MSSPRLPPTDTLSGPPSGRLVSFSMVSVRPMASRLLHFFGDEPDAVGEAAPQDLGPLFALHARSRDQQGSAHQARGLLRRDRNCFAAGIDPSARPAGGERQIGRRQLAVAVRAELQGGNTQIVFRPLHPFLGGPDRGLLVARAGREQRAHGPAPPPHGVAARQQERAEADRTIPVFLTHELLEEAQRRLVARRDLDQRFRDRKRLDQISYGLEAEPSHRATLFPRQNVSDLIGPLMVTLASPRTWTNGALMVIETGVMTIELAPQVSLSNAMLEIEIGPVTLVVCDMP